MQIEYDINLHSVFLLQYHLYSLELIEFNHDKDHKANF